MTKSTSLIILSGLLFLSLAITISGKWCVPKNTSSDEDVKKALDWACGNGADCRQIAPSGPCRQIGNVKIMAKFVYNDYWLKQKNNGGTCDFQGTAVEVDEDPSFGDCKIKNGDA